MRQVVYVASPKSQQIHVFQLKEDGTLILLQVVDVAGEVQPMAVHPKKGLLYAGIRPNFYVLVFNIAENGTLTEANQVPLLGSPTHISTDHEGKFLFCSSYNNACISISPIDKYGLPQPPIQVINGLDGCHSASIDNTNQILLVPVLKQDRICLFTVCDYGKLTPHKQVQVNTVPGAGPRHMVFHPNCNVAYCINELNSSIDVWAINAVQNVHCIQTIDIMSSDYSAACWAADIHLTSDGRFLYACSRSSSTLSIFSINKNGTELKMEGIQPTEKQPRGFNIDYSGHYLIVAGQKSHHIEVYNIMSPHGLLKPLGRYLVGQGPMWVLVHYLAG